MLYTDFIKEILFTLSLSWTRLVFCTSYALVENMLLFIRKVQAMNMFFMQKQARHFLTLLCVAVLVGAVVGLAVCFTPMTAHAAVPMTNCQGVGCEGLDPQTAGPGAIGCATIDGRIIKSAPILFTDKVGHTPYKVLANLYLWYSPTCGTNWGQIVNTSNCNSCSLVPDQKYSSISVTRGNITVTKSFRPENGYPNILADEDHTYMLYTPIDPVTVEAMIVYNGVFFSNKIKL